MVKLAIVVGHERRAQGAQSVRPLLQSEYVYNSDVAQRLFRLAMSAGIQTRVFFRDQVGLSGVYSAVHEWTQDADRACAIELHFNAANGRAQGTETLYDADPAESFEFAELVHIEVSMCFGRKGKGDRGMKLLERGDRGHYNLFLCKIPSCLVEPFFGDNPDDAKLAHARIQAYPEALCRAAKRFLLR